MACEPNDLTISISGLVTWSSWSQVILTSKILNGEFGLGMIFPKYLHIAYYGKQIESNSEAKGPSLNSASTIVITISKIWRRSLEMDTVTNNFT